MIRLTGCRYFATLQKKALGLPILVIPSTLLQGKMGIGKMQIWNVLSWKTLSELQPGEFARTRLGGGPVLVLKLEEKDGHQVIGIIEGDERFKGTCVALKVDPMCISFGTECCLDAGIDGEIYPDNPSTHDAATFLYFGPQGFVLKFAGREIFSDTLYFSINQGKVETHLAQGSAPILKWSIWTSEKHRSTAGEEAIFRFNG